jgi:hypothetical protein
MEVETLGVARSLGWKVHTRCVGGHREENALHAGPNLLFTLAGRRAARDALRSWSLYVQFNIEKGGVL